MLQRTTSISSRLFAAVVPLVLAVAPAAAAGPAQPSVWSITTSLVLAWDEPDGVRPLSYIVEAGTAPGLSDVAVFETGSSQTSVYVAPVPPGTYYARVRARNASGVSDPSNEIMINAGSAASLAAGCSAPRPPIGVSSTIDGTTVAVRWTASAGAGSYHLEAGTTSGSSDVFSGNVGNATAVQAVVPAGHYFVRIHAVSACGTSASSHEIGLVVVSPQ